MKATYPRQGNLDERFDNTASIRFQAVYVAEQHANNATVQANFTETYDSGASRQFIDGRHGVPLRPVAAYDGCGPAGQQCVESKPRS